jgi:hypothetical protein
MQKGFDDESVENLAPIVCFENWNALDEGKKSGNSSYKKRFSILSLLRLDSTLLHSS